MHKQTSNVISPANQTAKRKNKLLETTRRGIKRKPIKANKNWKQIWQLNQENADLITEQRNSKSQKHNPCPITPQQKANSPTPILQIERNNKEGNKFQIGTNENTLTSKYNKFQAQMRSNTGNHQCLIGKPAIDNLMSSRVCDRPWCSLPLPIPIVPITRKCVCQLALEVFWGAGKFWKRENQGERESTAHLLVVGNCV